MISFGTKVSILPCSEYGNRFVNWTGVVSKWHQQSERVGVIFYDLKNPNSKDGVFWFRENNLAIINELACMGDVASRPWYRRNPNGPLSVKRIIFSGPKTIVLWNDGDKTIVSCGEGDQFDPYAGFCAAVTKKVFGSTSAAKKLIVDFIPNNESRDDPYTCLGLAEALKRLTKRHPKTPNELRAEHGLPPIKKTGGNRAVLSQPDELY